MRCKHISKVIWNIDYIVFYPMNSTRKRFYDATPKNLYRLGSAAGKLDLVVTENETTTTVWGFSYD